MTIIIDCYWMLDAILEYISTDKLPHVFLEDNVKINKNNTPHYLTERLEHNELYKLDYINIYILINIMDYNIFFKCIIIIFCLSV